MFGLLVKVYENNLNRQMSQNVKVFPIYGRPPKFLPPNNTLIFFYVPREGIKAVAVYIGSKWLDPQNRTEVDQYRTYEDEKEWDEWVTKGKGRVRGVIFYKDLEPTNIPWDKVKFITKFYKSDLQPAYLPLDEEITGELITRL
jgi:hypothetical protein